jgi:hypothetical protein
VRLSTLKRQYLFTVFLPCPESHNKRSGNIGNVGKFVKKK